MATGQEHFATPDREATTVPFDQGAAALREPHAAPYGGIEANRWY
jgi:hypothetical protein